MAKGIPNTRSKKIPFTDWKKRCQLHADKLGVVAGDDLWGANDSYSLMDEAEKAWAENEKPGAFVERMFAEDLASAAHDAEMARESMEEGLAEAEDFE